MSFETLIAASFKDDLKRYFIEDDLHKNYYYLNKLPMDIVSCKLNLKDEMILAGIPFFVEVFKYLGGDFNKLSSLMENEGNFFKNGTVQEIELPFAIAVTGERIALNLLQHLSGIATYTHHCVEKALKYNIKILDTRKTLPGLRSLQKYAVRIGGGYNHRMGQTDVWMIKDNHKNFFGGIKNAVKYFYEMHGFYVPIILEVHSIPELKEAIELNINYVLMDNFTPELLVEAIKIKPAWMTFEVSGGVTVSNLEDYLIDGVDAISMGSLTTQTVNMDISLKYDKVKQ